MGTRFELVLCESTRHPAGTGESQTHLRAVCEQAIEEIQTWDRAISRFSPGSVTTRLVNAAAVGDNGRFVSVDARMFELLRFCEEMRVATGRAFDVSYGSNAPHKCDDGIEFDVTGLRARLTRPGQTLDLGAVGKGFALDCVAEILREHAVTRALVHGGTSSVLAIGEWSVGVRLAGDKKCVVRMSDTHLSVSSSKDRAHIIDGRRDNTAPTVPRVQTTAVLVPLRSEAVSPPGVGAGTVAEAWSTALMVLGQRPACTPAHVTTLIERESGEPEVTGQGAAQCLVG